MSIEQMIAEHPDVGGDYNPSLGRAVKHAMLCSAICNSCADACSAEDGGMDLRQCIRLTSDCADICQAVSRVAARRTGGDRETIRALLAVCIRICRLCAEECARHDHDHCRRCAQMCRECADDCFAALETLNVEAHAEA